MHQHDTKLSNDDNQLVASLRLGRYVPLGIKLFYNFAIYPQGMTTVYLKRTLCLCAEGQFFFAALIGHGLNCNRGQHIGQFG